MQWYSHTPVRDSTDSNNAITAVGALACQFLRRDGPRRDETGIVSEGVLLKSMTSLAKSAK